MSRVPLPPRNELSEAQRRVYDAIAGGPRGQVRPGPLHIWLQSPGLAERAQELGAFCRLGTSLPPRLSELAILTTAVHWQAAFEWNAHEPFAIEGGLLPSLVDALRRGEVPDFTQADERIVHTFASELLRTREVSDATWAEAVAALTLPGVVELIGILGYYALISMTINACRLEPASGAPRPFAASAR